MNVSEGRSDRAWRRLCAYCREHMPSICWLCGKPIDQTLHHNDPMAWTLDHVKARSLGGLSVLGNVRPAHRRHNSQKGIKPGQPSRRSRQWT
jgi:5-methylcytosine-specific restriction endonuclease McrA